jgi:hypothetical protein
MINPAEVPQISGDMGALAQHAADLSSVGTGFTDTGSRVHSTWQGLAIHYDAPEAAQLFAATTPIPTMTASVGEDLGAVGSALSAYAGEVAVIQSQLTTLQNQATDFVNTTATNPDWRDNTADVDHHNGLLAAVSAAVAQFQDAERRCANTILALYTDQRYVVDNGDGVVDPGEYGFTRETYDAASAEGLLPWGATEQVDRGFLGDVGAFFSGAGEATWGAVTGLGALVGLGPDGFSWETAGAAWTGLGTFALAISPVGLVNAFTDLPGLPRGTLPGVLLDTGKALIAYDTWGQDPARAGGMAAANILTAVLGTKGAGAGLRGAGAAASTSRVGVVANAGAGLLRIGEGIGRLPSVSDIATGALARFRGLEIPPIDLPSVDLPPTHVDPPRVELPPAPAAGPSIADGLGGVDAPRADAPAAGASAPTEGTAATAGAADPPGTPQERPAETAGAPNDVPPPDAEAPAPAPDEGRGGTGPGTAVAAGDPPPPIDPDAPRADAPDDQQVGTASTAADPPAADGGRPGADAEPRSADDRQPALVGAGSAEAAPGRPPAEAPPGAGAGQFDLAGDRAPEGVTASAAEPGGRGSDAPTPVERLDAQRPAGGDDARSVDVAREADRPAGPPAGGGPAPGSGAPDAGGGPPEPPAERAGAESGPDPSGPPDRADAASGGDPGTPDSPDDQAPSDGGDADGPSTDEAPAEGPPPSVASGPEKARLIEQLQESGTKVDPEAVVRIGADPNGRIVWIEEGGVNPNTGRSSGLHHVMEKHGDQFAQHGVAAADVPELVQRAATEGRYTGYLQGAKPGRPIFEVEFNGQTHHVAVSVGNNGYIVGAGMRSADTPFAGAKPDPRFADDPTFRGW